MTNPVQVTQADIDAARSYWGFSEDAPKDWVPADDKLVQAFARHRIAALTPARSAYAEGIEDAAKECPLSPFGRHQVDTSMESGPNNCFFCEQPMRALGTKP